MKKIKTFEAACKALGIKKPADVLPAVNKDLDAGTNESLIAFVKLQIIAKALNEGWKPNWNDSSEYKYYPYFDMEGGFVYYGSGCSSSALSYVGSRLCYKSRELAEYAGKQFKKLYKDFMTL